MATRFGFGKRKGTFGCKVCKLQCDETDDRLFDNDEPKGSPKNGPLCMSCAVAQGYVESANERVTSVGSVSAPHQQTSSNTVQALEVKVQALEEKLQKFTDDFYGQFLPPYHTLAKDFRDLQKVLRPGGNQ